MTSNALICKRAYANWIVIGESPTSQDDSLDKAKCCYREKKIAGWLGHHASARIKALVDIPFRAFQGAYNFPIGIVKSLATLPFSCCLLDSESSRSKLVCGWAQTAVGAENFAVLFF